MYGSIGELMAADPSFAIPGVVPSRREPVLPTEDPDPAFRRLIRDVPTDIRRRSGGVRLPLAQSDMQEKMQPALPPMRKAQMNANKFLDEYIGLGQDMGDTAQRIYPSWIVRPVGSINYSDVRRELRKLGVRNHTANEYVYDMMDEYIGGGSWPPDPVE